MDRAHRKELKQDKFVERVGYSVEYAAEHKSQVFKYAGLALAILVAGAGLYWYLSHTASGRQEELRAALRVQEAQIGPTASDYMISYPTQEEKDKAVVKSFSDLASKYAGKREGTIASYFLGVYYADKGNLQEAEKHLKQVADSRDEEFSSQAKLSLADIYESTNREAEAEKLLRSLVDDPTVLVSKEQATIALARIVGKKNPAEARKLLEPLRAARGPVSRAAIAALGELPAR